MSHKSLVVFYSLSGRTKIVAECIKELTNSDIEEVVLVKPYSKLSSFTRGLVNITSNKYPEIKNKIDISEYDRIYIGAPTWYFTLNPVIARFLKDNDLTGKEIYPFYTNEGAKGNSFDKVNELAKNANIHNDLEVTFVNSKSKEEINSLIKEWLDS